MQIKIYTGFEKKKNSTKQPDVSTTALTLTGTLKEPCSVMNPVFKIKRLANDASPSYYNYAYIDDFDRYYFITDWRWVEPYWEASLSVDVLASYRTKIGTLSEYVLRTDNNTSGGFDGDITDTLYPATTDFQTDHLALGNTDFVLSISSGCYVIGIISNNNTNSVGAISYYVMDSSEFNELKRKLLSNANLGVMDLMSGGTWTSDDMSMEIFKTMYNPFQYIASCMWFPFTKSNFSGSAVTTIPVGWWSYSLSGKEIYAQVLQFRNCETCVIPAHPQAATRGNYLNFAPYTKMCLYGRFGTTPIDPSLTKAGWTISITYNVDVITGQAKAFIVTYDDTLPNPDTVVLADRMFGIGVPIQLAQVGVDYLGEAVAAVDTVANTVSSAMRLDVAGAASSAAHGIYNTLQAAMPQMSTSGSNGSFLSPYLVTHAQFHHYLITDENITHYGRPLCQHKTINTLSGYVLCADGEIDISCLEQERDMIAGFLTSGFFWE